MRPHVLHVMEALGGGTARHLIDVVRHASGADHAVVVPPRRVGGLADDEAIGHLRAAGARIHLLPMRRTPWAPSNAVALARLRRLVRRHAPDVVHGHSSVGGLLARVAAAGTGIPTVYTPNGITQVRIGVLAERLQRRLTDMFVAVSASEADLAVRAGLVHRRKVVVIPNGIEPDPVPAPLDLRAELGIPEAAPLAGSIARLVPQKAPEVLIRAYAVALARVPDAWFVLIGDGELETQVEREIDATGIRHRLRRIPALAGAAGVLGQLDVFALSSRFEGGPYAPLEAMRAGTPVVLTAVVGSRDTVEPGVSGLVVPPEDPVALGQAIASLLEDPDRARAMGTAGRDLVRARFDVRAMGAALGALYEELAVRRRTT